MVEEEAWRHFTFVIKCGHGLGPLSEVVNYHNDVFMIVGKVGLIVMNLISHLQKGPTVTTGCNGAGGFFPLGQRANNCDSI